MHVLIEGTQTNNSAKSNMQNENMEVTNNSTSQISSARGKIAVNESKHPTSKEDDRLSSDKSIKATSAIDSETGSSKSLDGDFVSFNTPDSATKTLENLGESPTNSSKKVAFCKGDTEATSNQVAKSKNIKSVADFYGKITNTNCEYKESVGITDLNLSYNFESKPTFDTNVKTISKTDSNKTDLTKNSLENVNRKQEIANKTIRNKPLSAREILKKSIEIRGKRLERIAVSQNLEEDASKVNVLQKSDAKEENIIEDVVEVTSIDEENQSETKTDGLNTSQNIEGGDKNVLEVNQIERGKVEENEGTKNTEVLGVSAIEVGGSIGETGVNVVKQNFHKDFQGNSDVKCSESTFPTSNFIENADKIVENGPVNIRKGKSRKRSNISRNLVKRNVGSSPLGEDTKNCGEEDSTSLQTRRLRQRTAPQQSSSSVHENLVVQEEIAEKNSSGGKLLRKASKGRRKTAAKVNSTQSFDTNECQSSKKLSNELKLECQSSEKLSTEYGENNHSEEAEIFEEQSLNALKTSRKSSQSGIRKLRNETVHKISKSFGEFEENVDTKQENIEVFNAKSVESSEKALSGSSKVKRKRGRPKAVAKVIGSVDNTACELSNSTNGKKLPNIDGLLRDVLENLTKSSTESVKKMSKSSAERVNNLSMSLAASVDNLTKNSAEKVGNISKHFAENAKNLPTTSAKDLEKCVASIENVVAVKKKKVGRPKRVGKNHEVRKLLESASFNAAADVFEEFDNCGVADINRLEPVARRLRKRSRSTGNSTKYVESDGDDSENSWGKSEKPLQSDGENSEKPLTNSVGNSEKHLENIIVMLADGPKTTLDPQVQLLNEMMSGNKSKTLENRDLEPQSSATYCTNNLSEDGLRMIIKKENNNSLENKNSSPEIYEEDIFEYRNVIHKVRYIIRKEKIKQEEAISDDRSDTNHEKNVGDNKADEIINNQLIQAIKEEPNDNAEELLLENEGNETREYTVNNLDQKEKLEEKPFANQQETIRFRTRNRGGRRSYLIPKSVDISGYVNRCKQTTADNNIDKKYDRNIHGNYTMEIKSEIADAENNNFISNLVGVAKRARRSRRVRRRVRVSKRILDGTKMSKNKVENSVNALELSENFNSALENHVESVRNSTDKVESVKNSTDKIESVRNSTNKVESVRNSTDKVQSVRNSTDNVESHSNSTDMVQSARNNIDRIKRLRNSTVDAESLKNSINAAGNVQSSLNHVENVKNSTNDVENCTNDFESVKTSINATGNVENSLNDSENSTEVARNVKNSTVTTSTGPNKIQVKSLASLMYNFGSNHSKNEANGAGPSKSPSNRLLVRNLANLVSKLDSIAKNDVKNLEETACKADLHNDNGIVKHSSNLNNEISKSLDTLDSNKDDSEGVVSRSSDSYPNNSVACTLNSDSGKNLDKTGSTLTPGEDVSNMSGTGNSSPENNVTKSLSNNEFGADNVGRSLRKRKTIVNYDDNFFRIVDNFENSISCAEEVRNLTNFVSRPSSSYLATSNHIIVKSDTKIFSRKTKLFSKNNSTCKLKAICDGTKSVENVTDTSNDIETSVNNVNSLENSANITGKSQLEPNNIVRNHTTNLSRTPEPNCSDNFEIECNSPVKLEANTVPIDFDTVSNGGRHTVSNIDRDSVSNIESNTVSNRLHSKSNRRFKFSTVSNTESKIVSNTVSNRQVSVSDRGLNSDTVSNIASNTVSNRQDSVSNRCLNFDTVSNTDPNFEPDYDEEKYSALLEANRLTTVADDEFMKTIESFLDQEVKNSGDGVGKKARKKRRRPCELPALPESLKCETCGKVLKNRQSFEYHKTTHTDPKKQWMKCSCCQKLLAGERRLKSHMQNYHSLVKTFSCDRCKKIFHSRGNLYRHIVNVHLEPETYTCDICKKSFKKKSYLAQHINMHMGIRAHECNLCGKNFMNRTDLQNHLDAHVGFDRYVCGVCGKRLTSMQAMHVHMKYHTGENMFRCKYCDKEYATKSSLKEHTNVHTGKKYTCDSCGAQFSYRNGYKRHLQTHEGKQQECDICHKVFQRKCYLKKHMTTHMGTEQFMCVYCGKKFIEKSDYNIHVNRHTHAVKFPCEFCGKVFHNKGYLVDHRKMHTGDTKHVCKYCGKKFMKRGLLERHESIHEGTNFVKCDLCGAMLSSVNSCRRHLRGVHGVVL